MDGTNEMTGPAKVCDVGDGASLAVCVYAPDSMTDARQSRACWALAVAVPPTAASRAAVATPQRSRMAGL